MRFVGTTLLPLFLLAGSGLAAAADESPREGGVVQKVEGAVSRGAHAAASGVERGVKAAANGIERGAKATGRAVDRGVSAAASGVARGAKAAASGVERGARATGNAVASVANKVSPAASAADSGS